MSSDVILTGLATFSVITLYWSVLGTYVLLKTGAISKKAAPIFIIYSYFAWITSRIMYMNFPEMPPHPLLIVSGLVDSPQSILTTIYVYCKTRIIKVKWRTYILLYSIFLAVNRICVYLCRNLPVPYILVLPSVLSGWAALPAWLYIYVIANKIFSVKAASFIVGYQIFSWICLVFMLYQLSFPYSIISALEVIMNYPVTLLTLILIDRFRLSFSSDGSDGR